MPPKGHKVASTATTKSPEARTRNTRRKRAAETPPEEPIAQKKNRGAKRATAEEVHDEPANDPPAEAPRRRGRLARTANSKIEAPPGIFYAP